MSIERSTTPYIIFGEEPLLTALTKINANRARTVFLVDEHGTLVGSLTDGDVRRWLTSGHNDLQVVASAVANLSPRFVTEGTLLDELDWLFRDGITLIPVLDERHRVVAVASPGNDFFTIGSHKVGKDQPVFVIAEIGNNHQGQYERAIELVDLAVDAGADCVKFQLRDMDALYRGASGQITAGEDLGAQYTLDLLTRFSLPASTMIKVFDHCRERGVDVMCTPWDPPSLDVLCEYGVDGLKIASADLTNHTLLRAAARESLPMIVSTGMSTEAEIKESVSLLRRYSAPYALLQCQSSYPAPFKDLNLRYMQRLAEIGECPVGYSGHERGFHIPMAAVAMGATIIEKHFTTDRELEGNDHKVSLLPGEFASMVRQLREVEASLGTADARTVQPGEFMNRANLAKSLVAARDLAAGHKVTGTDVEVKSPGRGLQPNRLRDLVGRVLTRDVMAGDFFYDGDVNDDAPRPRPYTFRRPWGVPVRYHDFRRILATGAAPDFLEFHYSYKDLDMDVDEVFADFKDQPLPMGYTCHLPDLFSGDFILDLASKDDEIWERSIRELQRTIDITRSLRPYFRQEEDPVFIATLGGFTERGFVSPDEVPAMYDRIIEGLKRVDHSGVRLAPQTLPPYPWLLGGQKYHNLFMSPEALADFAERSGLQITYDISHSVLSANHEHRPLREYTEILAPLAAHLHIVDGKGVDGEGTQIEEGDVNWPELAEQLDRLAPGVSFIPEIWMGHVNDGEGFWKALDRLEKYL
ncbi:MAG: N-acetylneuraminate synthase family protein [Actinomyces urogenitalis]|uniref:N-acetylneuraminate synthase family protein n=1 Tax=Actinomyces urogenitalis TaxID=103621 RepID=UPI002A7FE2B6|nr:N-acetylneuraminate synthase family protein [Actinomyces urogenitalis]MDY3677859.1 N-acetylneuraminate synthase family protein [Actinomyces urogenitalis]